MDAVALTATAVDAWLRPLATKTSAERRYATQKEPFAVWLKEYEHKRGATER